MPSPATQTTAASGVPAPSPTAHRLIGWFLLIPLCIVLVVFALANRHVAHVGINPFVPPDAAAGAGMPLFLIIYAALFLGIALGGVAVWWSQGVYRRALRQQRKRADQLEAELAGYRDRAAAAADPAIAATEELGR